MSEKKILTSLLCLVAVLGFSVAGTRGADILFISAMDDAIDPGESDDVLKAFMEGLGHTVTYLTTMRAKRILRSPPPKRIWSLFPNRSAPAESGKKSQRSKRQ